jgi:hypothetical protein
MEREVRVLVACEFSGTVRDAFREAGHWAVSADLLPSESPGPHYQGDVRDLLRAYDWDLMIAHPPCTYLSLSGSRWLYEEDSRWQDMIEGAVFFRELLTADVPRIAIENPVMHGWAAKVVGRTADQTIQPYQFGHPETKRTQLWLKNLPPLQGTNDVEAEMRALPEKERHRIWWMGSGSGHERSVFYEGIARAMADQWGALESGGAWAMEAS